MICQVVSLLAPIMSGPNFKTIAFLMDTYFGIEAHTFFFSQTCCFSSVVCLSIRIAEYTNTNSQQSSKCYTSLRLCPFHFSSSSVSRQHLHFPHHVPARSLAARSPEQKLHLHFVALSFQFCLRQVRVQLMGTDSCYAHTAQWPPFRCHCQLQVLQRFMGECVGFPFQKKPGVCSCVLVCVCVCMRECVCVSAQVWSQNQNL